MNHFYRDGVGELAYSAHEGGPAIDEQDEDAGRQLAVEGEEHDAAGLHQVAHEQPEWVAHAGERQLEVGDGQADRADRQQLGPVRDAAVGQG